MVMIMNIETVEQLIRLVEQSSITRLEIEEQELTIRISKEATAPGPNMGSSSSVAEHAEAQTTASNTNPRQLFRSPMVGSFQQSSGEDDSPLVHEGDQVQKGQPLCMIEAMKMLNMVESDRDGTVTEILVEQGQAVEFGQPLFVITD